MFVNKEKGQNIPKMDKKGAKYVMAYTLQNRG